MTFQFTVDAFPGYVKGASQKTLAALQILGADDNYDAEVGAETGEVTYKRYQYNENTDGFYFGSEKLTSDDTEVEQ